MMMNDVVSIPRLLPISLALPKDETTVENCKAGKNASSKTQNTAQDDDKE